MSDRERRFAYGCWNTNGCSCPAETAVGGSMGNADTFLMTVVDAYDAVLGAEKPEEEGFVSEAEAEEAWLEAIENVDDARAKRAGRRIAEKLGWV